MRIDWWKVLTATEAIVVIIGIAATAWKDYQEAQASKERRKKDGST